MRAYFDSSALVAVYVSERHSRVARRELRRHESVPWLALHDLEVRNALRLLRGRGHIDGGELAALQGHIDEDLEKGRLVRVPVDLDSAFLRAGDLSRRHTPGTLSRTLDLLHVAAPLEIGCTTLVSGDERQLSMAAAEGLEVVDIRSGSKASGSG